MSHELRTPLNAILGFSEVMKTEIFGPHSVSAYKDYANDIHSSGVHLLGLINENLDLSRIEAGRYELNEEAVSLTLRYWPPDVVQPTLSQISPPGGVNLMALPRRLRQIWRIARSSAQSRGRSWSNAS